MKARKKNAFFTFICSFCPGAAEMYMGFMKNGLSILVAFLLPMLVTVAFYGGDYLAMIAFVVYAYAFFHARNIATAPDEEFSMLEDRYVWEEFSDGKPLGIPSASYRKGIAVILILIGISGVWTLVSDTLFDLFRDSSRQTMLIVRLVANGVPRVVFAVLVIVAGIWLIRLKKQELDAEGEKRTISSEPSVGESKSHIAEVKAEAADAVSPVEEVNTDVADVVSQIEEGNTEAADAESQIEGRRETSGHSAP